MLWLCDLRLWAGEPLDAVIGTLKLRNFDSVNRVADFYGYLPP